MVGHEPPKRLSPVRELTFLQVDFPGNGQVHAVATSQLLAAVTRAAQV